MHILITTREQAVVHIIREIEGSRGESTAQMESHIGHLTEEERLTIIADRALTRATRHAFYDSPKAVREHMSLYERATKALRALHKQKAQQAEEEQKR